ncbi:MAG: F510_1955 family glycosylhydrolase [Ilumatobacteraceae bacterium]
MRILLTVGAVLLLAILTLFLVWLIRPDSTVGGPGPDAALSHVHGLGLNPADGSLVVATHFGSFRISDGGAVERLGSSEQDTMGFTVLGPDHFLGSGHPDRAGFDAWAPSRLGVIESRDGGATWDELALGGEADLHAIAVAEGVIYGWDASSGQVFASDDGVRWAARSSIDVSSLVADPADADVLLATTPQGIRRSDDGGSSWAITRGPNLVVLTWDAAGGLWGADADGGLHRRDVAGWTRTGALLGAPQALLATPDRIYAATANDEGQTAIAFSLDGGASWTTLQGEPQG